MEPDDPPPENKPLENKPPEDPIPDGGPKPEPITSGPVHVEFSLDQILATARKGHLRAAVFTGLGCNAALRPDLVDYQLDHDTHFRLLPDTIPPETMAEWKDEFYRWIVTNGLRESVDFTNRFLDQIYEAVSIATYQRRDKKALKKFDRAGLKDKVATLQSEFGLTCRYPGTLVSVGAVRNCLVHRLGVVGAEDVDTTGNLSLSWFGLAMLIMGKDGKEIPGPSLAVNPGATESPIATVEGNMLAARFQIFTEQFALGARVVIRPHVLHQVLFSVQQMSNDYVAEVTKWARAKGVLKE